MEVIKFIFNCVISVLNLLFSIEIPGFMSIGMFLAIVSIIVPLIIKLFGIVKEEGGQSIGRYYLEDKKINKKD